MKTVEDPYELLFRWTEGVLVAAHFIREYRIYNDQGSLITATAGDPQPVSLIEGEDSALLEEVLGEVNLGSVKAIAAAQAAAQQESELREATEERLGACQSAYDGIQVAYEQYKISAQEQFSLLNSEVQELTAQLGTLKAQVSELIAEKVALQQELSVSSQDLVEVREQLESATKLADTYKSSLEQITTSLQQQTEAGFGEGIDPSRL